MPTIISQTINFVLPFFWPIIYLFIDFNLLAQQILILPFQVSSEDLRSRYAAFQINLIMLLHLLLLESYLKPFPCFCLMIVGFKYSVFTNFRLELIEPSIIEVLIWWREKSGGVSEDNRR